MDFYSECKRKGELLDLFWDLQENERKAVFEAKKKHPHIKYDRMFRGLAFVEKIRPDSVKLVRENGKVIKSMQINPKISALLKPQDHFFMVAGRREGLWRVISMEGIGTPDGAPGRESQIHFSVMNPLKNTSN